MLGLIARSDKTGLGYQTRNLAYMLKPDKIMLIDSTSFNGNKQHPEWYDGFDVVTIKGFPREHHCRQFITGLTKLVMCENPYNFALIKLANEQGIKTFIQYNWEFLEYHRAGFPRPTNFWSPSYWHLDKMQSAYPDTIYLPPPSYANDFKTAREVNFNRSGKRRFLHIIGKAAHADRNGTASVILAALNSKNDFELVIKSQTPIDKRVDDKRIVYEVGDPDDQADLYADFDAMILPRRYGGLCLPMNEALLSGLPVIMTDISPNNRVLPAEWLVPATVIDRFLARTMIDVYEADINVLTARIDGLCDLRLEELNGLKAEALQIALENYTNDRLLPKYEEALA